MALAVGTLVCLSVTAAWAQQTTTATEMKSFEVIAVDGNNLVVRLPEGTREMTVPDDFRFTVDGRPMSVHELKPGMKGTAAVTTKTTVTPVTVTEVRNGTVMQVSGVSIIVRTDDGIKAFSQADVDKRGVRIVRNGEPASISDFRTGDTLTATIVTTKPPRVVTEKEVQATLAREAPAAPAPTATAPAAPTPSSPPAPAGTAGAAGDKPTTLPKTGSSVPLVGLAGLASLLTAAGLAARRRRMLR